MNIRAWELTNIVTDQGLKLKAGEYIDIKDQGVPLMEFEFHFWTKLETIQNTMGILSVKVTRGSEEFDMQVIGEKAINAEHLIVGYQFGPTFVRHG